MGKTILGVVLLVLGLITGFVAGYYVAPSSSQASPASNTITDTIVLSSSTVHIGVLAGPMTDMLSFSVGGLKNPTIQVKPGTEVEIHFINIDDTHWHSMIIVSQAPPFGGSLSITPAFAGASTPNVTTGMPPGSDVEFSFTASQAGTYYYLCGFPGHAAAGMYGKFVVKA